MQVKSKDCGAFLRFTWSSAGPQVSQVYLILSWSTGISSFIPACHKGSKSNEPQHEKTNNVDFDQVWHKPGCTAYWRWLEAGNFGFRKKRYCTIQEAKTKALISFAVTAKLICVFVFAYAERWFSHDAAQIESVKYTKFIYLHLPMSSLQWAFNKHLSYLPMKTFARLKYDV